MYFIMYMQTIPLLSTAYLPPLSYMMFLFSAETAFIELYETYQRQTWRNRCRILTGNGLLNLSIPVTKPGGNHTKTKEVLISRHENWQAKHWRAITSAYGKAPYFLYYRDMLEPFYKKRYDGLLYAFNNSLLELILEETGIGCRLCSTDAYNKSPEHLYDLRSKITPKEDVMDELLLSNWPPYYQVFSERYGFTANLSIIDLLFNMGPEAVNYFAIAGKHLSMASEQ